jgi:pimeloyl-ACP methyl ester carboxylesterase
VTIIELEAHRRTVTTPQGPVSCIDVGSGPAALFVHGVGTNALLWHHVIRAFAGERRCVAIDLPLHGRTPAALWPSCSRPGTATGFAPCA